MKYLTFDRNDKMMYYYKPYMGICSVRLSDASKREEIICEKGTDRMFVHSDCSGTAHILSAVKENTGFIYTQISGGIKRSCELGGINGEISIQKVMLGANRIGMSIFYSAVYNGEYILVHCMLGDNAMPETVDKLKNEHFFLNNMKVYYTNENGILGSRDFSDGKPGQLVYNSEGIMPYVRNINGEKLTAYIHNGGVYVNGRRLADDKAAEAPVICSENGRNAIVWKSGMHIKAMLSGRNDKVFTAAFGGEPELFVMSSGNNCRYCYGSCVNNDIRVFYSDDPFSEMLEENKDNKIKRLNKEIDELKEIIHKMKNNNA